MDTGMRAEDVTGIANKVAKRDERVQELIHKAFQAQRIKAE
jgi:(2Fe-2S) ferredoxin